MAEEHAAGALDPRDLLLADLEHFESAMARNEETGEKRFSFLISLLTAVGGGLGALYTADDVDTARVIDVAAGASLVLAVFAILTYLRLLQRNRVTDEHKETLSHIRDTYRRLCPPLADGYQVPAAGPGEWPRVFRGGYAETTGVVTGGLIGASLWLGTEVGWPTSVVSGAAAATVLVLLAVETRGGKNKGREKQEKDKDTPAPLADPGTTE